MKDEVQKARLYAFILVLVFSGAYIYTKAPELLRLIDVTLGALVMSLRQSQQ